MIINLSRIDFGGVATGGGTLVPLTVEASNENRTFEPSSYGADGFNSVNANGYDVDALYNLFDDIYNNDTASNPTVFAEWDLGTANVFGAPYNSPIELWSCATTRELESLESINWKDNRDVTQITIHNAENLITYSEMFNNTQNLRSITADLGHKEGIDMSYMFKYSGIRNIMNLGLETCKPTSLRSFAHNTKFTQMPWMDTSQCTSFFTMLSGTNFIETLPAYSYAALPSGAINWGRTYMLTIVEGLVDLGKSFTQPYTISVNSTYNPALVKQSGWNIVNTVYDFVANNGAGNGSTLNFSGFNWEWDEGEQANLIAAANAKGWNIAF